MKPQDWYLAMLLRLDRIQAALNALQAFYDAPTEAESRVALAKLQRIAQPMTP